MCRPNIDLVGELIVERRNELRLEVEEAENASLAPDPMDGKIGPLK